MNPVSRRLRVTNPLKPIGAEGDASARRGGGRFLGLKPLTWLVVTGNLLLLLGIAYDALRIQRALSRSEAPIAAPAASVAVKSASERPVQVSGWNEWHPFGRNEAAQPVAIAPANLPDDAPETQLNLVLTGILSGSGRETRVAVRAGGDADKIYAIGDKLPGDARIVAVRPDRVILEKGGHHETLRLPRTVLPLDVKLTGGEAPSSAGEAAGVLRELREQFQTDPDAVLARIPMAVESRNGVFGGYRLLPGKEPGLLEKLGLIPGDVLTSVNGVALSSPAKGMEALGGLSRSRVLQVSLLRDGKAMTVHHALGGN
ncbi:MAG: type II secretion system protein GspC [Magnetococcales bacterium]|nr:type II secretion system protein GspC [Magnetococcales bacterium]